MLVLDHRSLGLYRLAIGVVVLLDLGQRALHLEEHYTAQGVLPLRAFLQLPPGLVGPSLFLGNDGSLVVGLLILLSALAATCLTLGLRTRAATAGTLVMLASLQYRNPLLLDGGDALLRCLLVWGLFLPWGETLALDSRRADATAGPSRDYRAPATPGTLALCLQVCQLYWFAALYKTGASWFKERDAVEMALNFDEYATYLATWVREIPYFSHLASPAVPLVEAVAPLFLLASDRLRWLGIWPLAILQLGFMATLSLGNFPLVALVALIPFVPTSFWEATGRTLQQRLDGALHRLSGAPWLRAEAIAPSAPHSSLSQGGAAVLLAIVVSCNILEWYRVPLPLPLLQVRIWTGVFQQWSMFSPNPPAREGWLGAQAQLRDGRHQDLLFGRDISLDAPAVPLPRLLDSRNRRLWTSLRNPGMEFFQKLYLERLVSSWNQAHPSDPVSMATLHSYSRPVRSTERPEKTVLVSLP